MNTIAIRRALPQDAPTIVEMVCAMMTDMASYGGYPPATDGSAWETVRCGIAKELTEPSVSYLMAEVASGEIAGVCGAKLITLGGAFAPRKTLHISVLFVRPHLRRRRIGDELMTNMLQWGSTSGAVECDLNVLVDNPARALYARHGFSAFQMKLLRPL
jgi:ribosomal protein S18 acetylase RimI-like enzyme